MATVELLCPSIKPISYLPSILIIYSNCSIPRRCLAFREDCDQNHPSLHDDDPECKTISAERKPVANQSIFISYRRDDCPAESRLVCDALRTLALPTRSSLTLAPSGQAMTGPI